MAATRHRQRSSGAPVADPFSCHSILARASLRASLLRGPHAKEILYVWYRQANLYSCVLSIFQYTGIGQYLEG